MARHRKLSEKEVDSILKGLHRVLNNRGVDQPIKIHFATAEAGLCWERRAVPQPDGSTKWEWVQVPC